ncbi:chromosome partitioning protein ParA [Vibrio parahaemolyticus]|nr:chromosome partitioning protein ParA [Vibrio parahaemolyticus]TOL62729.1 chromosome partitioning protein ParA [Vibrio parahaemolyticus]TOL90078.1 chromosome partitioning protein ParA [Vibrio parahaemolyticus]
MNKVLRNMSIPFHSQLFIGNVRHRRFTPVKHELNYSMFMPAIDLDEIGVLEKKVWGFGTRWWHWARFKRDDYLGEGSLKKAVQDKVAELTGVRCSGKVLAVCHLRYLGLYFSPVNFYYLYDQKGEWQYLLAEVSNTPWNERHYYAIAADPKDEDFGWEQDKAFHVSPFNPIDQLYRWKIKPLTDKLNIHLECHKGEKHFDATMAMKAQPFSSGSLLKCLIGTPIQTVKVMVGIYWHALKLWVKGAPFYSHPKYLASNERRASSDKSDKKNNKHKENSAC